MTRTEILVGLDGSPASSQALRWAIAHARSSGGRVRTISCWTWSPSTAGLAGYSGIDLTSTTEATARSQVAEALACTDSAVEVAVVIAQGSPGQILVTAPAEAALLVVGSQGHGSFLGAFLGSVSRFCVSHAHSPIVVVGPTDEAEIVEGLGVEMAGSS